MKAINYTGWTKQIKASEMPDNALEYMDARIFSDIIIPLREGTNIAMWLSSLTRAHVRHEQGKGAHHTNGQTNLASGTDRHSKTYSNILRIANYLETMASVGDKRVMTSLLLG